MRLLSRFRKCAGYELVILLMASFLAVPLLNMMPIGKAADGWWNSGWSYRKTVTIDHTKVVGSLSDFPVLIDMTDANLASAAQSDGDDIAFVDAGGTKLNHEIELFDSGTGHLIARVKMPSLSQATDTVLYMYYGNPTAGSQQNPTGVWDSNAKMALHLDETSGTHHDSSVNANNAVPYGGVLQGVSGKIAGADTFDGVNDYLQAPHSDTLTGFIQGFTASFWLRLDDVSRRQTILNKYNSGTSQRSWYIEFQTHATYGKVISFFASQDGTNYREWHTRLTPTAGTWYYITITWEPSTIPKFYVNGVQTPTLGTNTIASIYNNVGIPLLIGRCPYNTGRYLKGGLDEVRISNPARNAGWILSSYNSQKDPTTFYQLGTEEAQESPRYTITVDINGQGSVTKIPDQLTYANNTSVQLTAVPDSGWTFQTWSGDLSGNTNPTTITINGDRFVNATFAETGPTLGIDFSFDSASIGAYTIGGNEINFTLVTESLTTGEVYTYWTFFKTTNTLDKEVTFSITNAADVPFLSNTSQEAQMVYSYDGDNWSRFTNHSYSDGIYTFTGTFTNNEVYVATFFPFSYTEMQDYINTVDPSPWAVKSILGSSVQGREIALLKITNESIPDTDKKVIYIIGRQHSAETCSSHMLRGMIDFLISDNADAERIRNAFVWYIVPMVNPDGVYLGKSRGTSEDRNANRDWMNNETVEINIVRNHINSLNNSIGIDFFIDWHSQMDDDSWYNYVYSPPENTFFSILSAWTDFDSQSASASTGGSTSSCTARQYVSNNILYDPMFGLEPTPHLHSWTIFSLEQEGMNLAYAIDEYFTLEPFAIIVLPDTQFYSQSYPTIFNSQTQWIVDKIEDMNILFVLHEGDIVNNDVTFQWINANASMSLLDGHVPWAVLPGNHDGTSVGASGEDLSNYNTHFSFSRFSDETWYGGAYNDINTNSYSLFTGGEDDYIVFSLQYHPSDSVLAWATTTLNAHPNRRAIVVTHDYLNTDGTRTAEGNHIWNNFVAPHADQIFLVLCGHMHGEARRADTANGHTVYQLLADYQEGYPNGGNGWLRILDFRPTEDKIYVKTYSPYVNQYQIDADSQFTLDYDMTSDSPIKITIQSPEDGTTTMDNMPDFKFIPTHDDSLALNCSLWLQNANASYIYATRNNVNNGSLTTLTTSIPIPNGSWSWWINCTDGAHSLISEQRTMTIDTFRGDKTFTSTLDGSTRIYWLDLPDNFDNSTPTPLVVFLHGYEGSRLSYPQKYPTLRQTFQSNTWIVASVDCRTTSGYQNWYTEPSRRDITDILNTVKNGYNIDTDHIHMMGNSMGGGGALKYAMFNTQVIASLVDINGITNFTQFYNDDTQNQFRASLSAAYGGTPTQAPVVYANESALGNELRFENTPVMMLHGTADPTVSVSHSRNLNQSLSALGYRVNYIEVPGAGHDANSLITGRELLILNWFKDNPLGVHALTPVDSPSGDYRWMDVVDQIYSSGYRSGYTYSQATVLVMYDNLGESLTGRIVAQNLKPNFAYQLKLVGTPGTADNELIGFSGRWWQEQWNGTAWTNGQNLNDKGTGSSPNPNDNAYLARKSITDSTSPTGLRYRYTGYLLFEYFMTDSNGDANLYFETGNCYHVLWKTSQQTRTSNDGPLKTVTFDPILSAAYEVDYPSSTVSIFGEWERLPMGSVNLSPGDYDCQLVLTEESFHGTGPLEGNWAAAMNANISFTIVT